MLRDWFRLKLTPRSVAVFALAIVAWLYVMISDPVSQREAGEWQTSYNLLSVRFRLRGSGVMLFQITAFAKPQAAAQPIALRRH
jgi:hypothetical protein